MKFYHGTDDHNVIEKAKNKCPGLDHSYGFTPNRMVSTAPHYFLDNGAFTKSFDEDKWISALDKIEDYYDNKPDFVVLPDVFNDAEKTWKKHRKYYKIVEKYGFKYYYVAQPPFQPEKTVKRALKIDASGIFLGGSWHKPSVADSYIEEAKKQGLKFHIGMPKNYKWVCSTNTDSFDSVSVARNKNFKRLEKLQEDIEEGRTERIKTRQKRLNSLM